MSGARHWEQDKEATVYVGNLDERVTDGIVWELMLQAGRIVNVHLPKDRVTQVHQGYGFVEFKSEEDADYAARIMNQVRLYGKPIRVNKASADKQKSMEIGAELFVGNLDPMVTEQMLYETFSRFGSLIAVPKIARDEANISKSYGFVSFSNFEASDDAIANLNGQYLMNKEVSIQYAYKKDGKGERHGDASERLLASQAKKNLSQPVVQPITPQIFGNAPPVVQHSGMENEPLRSNHFGGSPPGMFPNGRPPTQNVTFQHMGAGHPPPPPPPRLPGGGPLGQQLPAPPTGLPRRPPPSQAGYGGPQGFAPPGFNSGAPSGFMPGGPPSLPPGFQTPGAGPNG